VKRFWGKPDKPAAPPPAPDDVKTRLFPSAAAAEERLLLVLPGGKRQEFTLSKASVGIGRSPVNDIVLNDPSASRRHARLERSAQGCEVIDLGSANGVTVNGVKIARAVIKPGDVFGIGDGSFRFLGPDQDPLPGMTRIDMADGPEAALPDTSLAVNLGETALSRVVVLLPTRTWEVRMKGDSLAIGRAPSNDIVIDSDRVSAHHAVIERRDGVIIARDLRSANGTWLRNERVTSQAIGDGETLRIGPATLVFKTGFAPEDLAVQSGQNLAARRPVVVVPGFAGSTLWSGSEQIWPTRAALTQLDLMRLENPLEARGLVNELVIVPNLIKQDQYSSLTNYLKESLRYEAGKDLLEFGYDFRQDNRDSAKHLAAAIDAWQPASPVTIIAHSMGCLITRYYVECLGGRDKVERIIFLGGPHAGTPYAFSSLLSGPNLLPLGLLNAPLRDLLATYPSWYQILPTYACVADQRSAFNVLTDESWLPDGSRPLLRRARAFRAELGSASSVPSVCVFGYDIKTITAASVEREPQGLCHKANFVSTRRGDGTIPESSSVLAGSEIHPVKQHHGSLFSDTDVKMRLKLELTRGAP
jgi:pSer/pThr/pTyr-binding forkhead associated (FHA) protein